MYIYKSVMIFIGFNCLIQCGSFHEIPIHMQLKSDEIYLCLTFYNIDWFHEIMSMIEWELFLKK